MKTLILLLLVSASCFGQKKICNLGDDDASQSGVYHDWIIPIDTTCIDTAVIKNDFTKQYGLTATNISIGDIDTTWWYDIDTVAVFLLVGDTKYKWRIYGGERDLEHLLFMKSGYEIRSHTGAHILFLTKKKRPLESRFIVWDFKASNGREWRDGLRKYTYGGQLVKDN